jgi:3-oxoacyl-[acyl-carrier protein] reductase
MDLQLAGRTAVITGGSQGIGLATATALAREGANVLMVARDQGRLDEAVKGVESTALGRVRAFSADVNTIDGLSRAVAFAEETWGAVDILVNNAGGVTNFGTFDDLTDADWLETFQWNVMAVVRGIRAVLPGMRERNWGRIINVSSESAVQPDAFFPHYAASKAMLMNLTKSTAKLTSGTGIRVNVVSPAFVKTPILVRMLEDYSRSEGVSLEEGERLFLERERPNISAGRAGRPEEVGEIIAVLCSPIADFIDGSNIPIDSGSVATI